MREEVGQMASVLRDIRADMIKSERTDPAQDMTALAGGGIRLASRMDSEVDIRKSLRPL